MPPEIMTLISAAFAAKDTMAMTTEITSCFMPTPSETVSRKNYSAWIPVCLLWQCPVAPQHERLSKSLQAQIMNAPIDRARGKDMKTKSTIALFAALCMACTGAYSKDKLATE